MIYFVPYIILCAVILIMTSLMSLYTLTSQLPGNLILRILGPRHWLTFSVVAWGAVQLGMGFVTNWGQLAATRVLMGMFEVRWQSALISLIRRANDYIKGTVLPRHGFPHLNLVRFF